MMRSAGSAYFTQDDASSQQPAQPVQPSARHEPPPADVGSTFRSAGTTDATQQTDRIVHTATRSSVRASAAPPVTSNVASSRTLVEGEQKRSEPSRVDQIIQHFYAKVTAVVTQARLTQDELAQSPTNASPKRTSRNAAGTRKTNKWFNLELPEPELFKSDLRMWKSVSSLQAATKGIPPLTIVIYLDTSGLNSSQAVVLTDQKGRRSRVSSTIRTQIVLERWTLRLQPPYTSTSADTTDLPAVYRLAILFFRTLYTLVRTMPAWALQKRLSRRGSPLQIAAKLGHVADTYNEIDVDVPIAEGETVTTETAAFPTVVTPGGTLALTSTYRLNADFSVEDVEALLSSRFINEDFFRPTIGRLQREDDHAKPGSLPSATSRPPTLHSTASSPAAKPSYGSLSSRHQLQPPILTSPLPTSVDPTAIPLPSGVSPDSVSSSGRFGSYGVSGSGAAIEPAFVSLSRARNSSYSGQIQRSTAQTMSGSGSSGSPSFRTTAQFSASHSPASYSPQGSGGAAGPLSNVYRVPLSSSPRFPSSGSPSPMSYMPRSPLAYPYAAPASTSASSSAARPIPTPTSTGGYPARAYSGSYSRSYGKGSSGGSMSGGDYASASANAGGWAGPESLGRRTSGRFSFESRYSTSGGASPGRIERVAEDKRFIVSPSVDEDDINDFVGLIDSKPDFGRSLGASMFASRSQADEALKKLKGSVIENSSTLESALGSTRLSGLRRQASRLSIEEEPPQIDQQRPPPVPMSSGRVRRRSLLAQQHSPQPSESSVPSTARYFSASSSPRLDASLPQYIPRAHRRSATGIAAFDLSRNDSPALTGSGTSENVTQSGERTATSGEGSGTHSLEDAQESSPAGGSILHHEGASSSYADDGVDEGVVGRLELSGPDQEDDDDRGRATSQTGVIWHAARQAPVGRHSTSRDRTPAPYRDYFGHAGNWDA